MPDAPDFIDLVRRMRAAQRAYAKTRHETANREKCDLERRVDRMLADAAALRAATQLELSFF